MVQNPLQQRSTLRHPRTSTRRILRPSQEPLRNTLMTPHEYLKPATKTLIQQTQQHLGENAALAAQAGANSIITEQELGNSLEAGISRITKIHEDYPQHQTLAVLAAYVEHSGEITTPIENWLKNNYNQPQASFETETQALTELFQKLSN